MDGELKVGDIVRDASSPEWMTVESVQDETVFCAWKNKNGNREHGQFLKATLIKINPDVPEVIDPGPRKRMI